MTKALSGLSGLRGGVVGGGAGGVGSWSALKLPVT